MRITLKSVLLTIIIAIQFFSVKAQFGALPPFSIQIEPIGGINIPGIHSFAFARSGDKWLFVGGRTNGLHSMNSNVGFASAYINDNIMVVDTATWQFFYATLNQLPLSVADPLRATNMEF